MRKLMAAWLLRAIQLLYPTATDNEAVVHNRIANVAEAMLADL